MSVHDFAMDLLILGIWVLAAARVTRLLTKDAITDFIRIWGHKKTKGQDTTLTYFLTCPWCVGMWVCLLSAWSVILLTEWTWWLYLLLALMGSHIIGLMAENFEDDDDIEIEVVP